MLGAIGLVTAGLGAAFAQLADRAPGGCVELAERSAGALLIAGLMLLGATLPVVP